MLTASYPTRTLQAWEKKIGALLVSDLLLANSSSGNKDGTGFGTTSGDYVKWEVSAGDIVFTPEYNTEVLQLISSPLIAHVRAISTGVGAKEGAHPFKAGNLLLAHNGTFTDYRKHLKDFKELINDDNPVDSHVIAHMLAKEVGSGELNQHHIKTTLESVKGSFALLITDATNNNLWVVTGSNPLYIQQSGPLWLVNTSKLNLDNVAYGIDGVANLLYGKTWKADTAERIEEYTINLLTGTGLVRVEDLDKQKHTVTYTQFRGGTGTVYTSVNKVVSSEDAHTRARLASSIVNLEYMDQVELILGCFILLEKEWWKAEIECLEVMHATLSKINDDFGTPLKKELWEELMNMTNQNAYAVVAAYTNIAFPYVLNSVKELRRFVSQVREDLKSSKSVVVVGDDNANTYVP